MITFAPIRFDEPALAHYGDLFAQCFAGASRFTADYLAWQYLHNPDGRAVGFDAWEGDVLAAHYVCLPALVQIDGRTVRVLLSLNTATAPAFQGQGLFTRLAALTYDAGAALGYDGVYGVANGNSTPGFVRKLGFQLVRPLEAMVGVGTLGTGAVPAQLSFQRSWTRETLGWRCASPYNPVRCRRRGPLWQFHAPALGRHVPAYAELALADGIAPAATAGVPPLRLFIGLVPDAARGLATFASIPRRLRPSPLNLIYRSFTQRVTHIDPRAVAFTFLDFDAY
ncbi:MAG TPA: GNAT family N-acetyltransferase [Telluria sp.]|nr:GNAT family N-acetyltransferase [Telluria sp.]